MKPSARRILDLLRSRPIRYLPKGAEIQNCMPSMATQIYLLGCKWEWSWTILQDTHTADYRKRISEINELDGYTILSFHAPYTLDNGQTITRHGYILVSEAKDEIQKTKNKAA